MIDDKKIGERIASARQSVGLTQAQAAKAVGVSPTAWASWEQGKSSPPLSRLAAISSLVNLSIAQIIGDVDYNADILANQIRSLDPDDRAAIERLVVSIKKRGQSAC